MDQIELLKKAMREGSDQQLNETISKGALKMSDEQIATASFVFWLVYMAETDLNDTQVESWEKSGKSFPPEVKKMSEELLQKKIKRKISMGNPEYFSEKIKVFEALFGEKNERTKLLWKLNDLRNDLSHNRINELKYDGQSLFLRKTKEKILFDYFDTSSNLDFHESAFWKSLSEDEKRVVETKYKDISKYK